MNRVVLSGYYGFDNAGDEAILYAIIKVFRKIDPDIHFTVLSNDPEKTAREYNVEACNRWKLGAVAKALVHSDLVISGGGSLLQDVSSFTSPLYYLGVILLAKILAKPVMVYAQGIGPLRRGFIRHLAAWLINRTDRVTVRDEGSRDELQAMGVTRTIIDTADPVLGIPREDIDPDYGRELLSKKGVHPNGQKKLLGVFIRPWEDNEYLQGLAQSLDTLFQKGWQPVFVPMQYPRDLEITKKATELMESEAIILRGHYSTMEILSLISNFDFVIGMRLHALIMGATAGVPIVGLSYDPKVDRFLKQLGHFSLISVNAYKAQTLVDMVLLGDDNRTERVSEMRERVLALYQKAWQNARIAFELLPATASENRYPRDGKGR